MIKIWSKKIYIYDFETVNGICSFTFSWFIPIFFQDCASWFKVPPKTNSLFYSEGPHQSGSTLVTFSEKDFIIYTTWTASSFSYLQCWFFSFNNRCWWRILRSGSHYTSSLSIPGSFRMQIPLVSIGLDSNCMLVIFQQASDCSDSTSSGWVFGWIVMEKNLSLYKKWWYLHSYHFSFSLLFKFIAFCVPARSSSV